MRTPYIVTIMMLVLFMAIPAYATRSPKQVYIAILEPQKDEANKRLENEGFGPENISIPVETKDSKELHYATSAVLQDWEYERFIKILEGLDYIIEVIDRTNKIVEKEDY